MKVVTISYINVIWRALFDAICNLHDDESEASAEVTSHEDEDGDGIFFILTDLAG